MRALWPIFIENQSISNGFSFLSSDLPPFERSLETADSVNIKPQFQTPAHERERKRDREL